MKHLYYMLVILCMCTAVQAGSITFNKQIDLEPGFHIIRFLDITEERWHAEYRNVRIKSRQDHPFFFSFGVWGQDKLEGMLESGSLMILSRDRQERYFEGGGPWMTLGVFSHFGAKFELEAW